MPTFSPYNLPPCLPVRDTKTFFDPRAPDLEITLTLEARVGGITDTEVMEEADKNIRRFVPVFEDGGRNLEAVSFAPPGERSMQVTEQLITEWTILRSMQVCEEEADRWDMFGWAVLKQRAPTAYREILAFSIDLRHRAGEPSKNGYGAHAATPLESPSNVDSETILRS